MAELMKQYEAETDKIAVVEHSTGKVYLPKYGEWLERKVLSLIDKAEAYDRMMSGGKKTPKEVANFFDLPIAQDKEGFWYAFGSSPVIDELRGTWGSLLGYEKEIPSCNIRYTGDWKDSLILPDGWEEA